MSVVLSMSMSVDGRSGDSSSPESYRPESGPDATVLDEMLGTGAVITGRRTFELAGQRDGDHHGVPARAAGSSTTCPSATAWGR